MKRSILLGLVALFSISCGGLSSDARLSGLSDDEISELCEGISTETEDCGNGVTITSDNSAECAESVKSLPDDCVATVNDYNQCESADLCDRPNDAACGKFFACVTPSRIALAGPRGGRGRG
jgi:hypothetical protein